VRVESGGDKVERGDAEGERVEEGEIVAYPLPPHPGLAVLGGVREGGMERDTTPLRLTLPPPPPPPLPSALPVGGPTVRVGVEDAHPPG